MSKNIIICSDGTGNSGGKGNVTNVWRVFEAINRASDKKAQVAFYDDGVGTESFKPVRILGGAFGYGLARNVKQLYTEICRIYEPGDKIFYFGFSRGAFTVRTLLGWILIVGLVDPRKAADDAELDELVDKSFSALRAHFRTIPQRLFISSKTAEERAEKIKGQLFQLSKEQKQSLGHFIGVWDTVDAVGFPVAFIAQFWNSWIHQFKFPDYCLDKNVRNAYHALAIDDERLTFHPQPWNEADVGEDQNLHQVWFSGMHSNVGGGYPQDGMAYVSLAWMMEAAQNTGLHFTNSLATLYRERANPMEKMYNSRSGLGSYYRFTPRNLSKISDNYNLRQVVIHPAVGARTRQRPGGYTPRHLPAEHQIWAYETDDKNILDDQCLPHALASELDEHKLSDFAQVSSLWDRCRSGLQWFVVPFTLLFAYGAAASQWFPNDPILGFIENLIKGSAPQANWPLLTIQMGVLLALLFLGALAIENHSSSLRSRFWTNVLRRAERLKHTRTHQSEPDSSSTATTTAANLDHS